jgi:tetratricopeptide (TPR) repeat protein
MHAALSSRLGNVSDLRVSPSRAVQAYEDTSMSMARIAGELGVGWGVTGNVQSTAEEIRVIVELVDPTTGTQRWSDDYTRAVTPDGLFDLQSEISREIAASLEAELTPEETERVERRPTEDLEAYRLYTKGRNLVDARRGSAIDSAKTYFRRALREDSTYALAWAGLADARILDPGWIDSSGPEEEVEATKEGIPAARQAARRALELDSELAEAHAAMGLILLTEQEMGGARGYGPAALRMLERAVELRPSYAQAHYRLGRLLLGLGRPEAASQHLGLAVELNPALVTAHRGQVTALLANGEYAEALASVRRSQERLDFLPAAANLEADALLHLHRWEDARALAREHGAGSGDAAHWTWNAFAVAQVELGDSAVARRRIEELMTRNERPDTWRHWEVAWLHAALGNDDAALSGLERIDFDEPRFGAPGAAILRFFYPRYFGPLRDTPRFRALIRDVNRFWGLDPDGSMPDSVGVSFGSETAE